MMHKRTLYFLASCAMLCSAQTPEKRAEPRLDPSSPSRVGVSITQRKLSLNDAVSMAMENNLDIEIERTNRSVAEQNVQVARGFFDPTFRWQPLLQTTNTPTGSILQGAGGRLTDRGLAQNFYVRQSMPRWGTQWNVDFENNRQTTTNPFTSFSPALNSRLAVGITQPLLRNRLTDRNRIEILVRRRNVDLTAVDVETRVIDIVTRVEQAYWDLVAAREAVSVSEESAKLAREQLSINGRLVEAGTLAPVEISAAEAEFERRLDTWYSNVGSLTEVENNLKTLIAPERSASIWNDELLPTEVRTPDPPAADDLPAAVKTAIARRPELRAIGVQQGINEEQKRLNNNLRKPEMNFVGQYSLTGLGGTILSAADPFSASNQALYGRINDLSVAAGLPAFNPPALGSVPQALVGGYGTSLNNLFGGNYQSFQVGLSFDFTIRNRTAEANYGNTLINEKRIRLERIRTEQIIESQVRNALQGIQTARQRIQAAEASTRAAREKLDSESRLYQTGESTNFLVLTRQNEYADSRRREVLARLDLNKSVARLQQAVGSTLSTYSISLR